MTRIVSRSAMNEAAKGLPAAPDDAYLETLTVDRVQEGFRSGALTAESLVRACLRRIERLNGHYNAVIFLNLNAIDEARQIDRRREAGEHLGPLAGVPIVVKDTMDVAGLPTTGGWSQLCAKMGGVDLVPERDAPVVARMRQAGAIILGKTNVPMLSHSGSHANTSWAGPTLNAAIAGRAPGASSAGTATAVAAGMAVLGLAEETGGSIQNPAAAQDLVGVRPTLGLVPNVGILPLSGNRDVVGPLARCVRDAALCLDVLAGYSPEDPKTLAGVGHVPERGYASALRADALRGARFGLYGPGWREQSLSAETAALYEQKCAELRRLGAELVDDPFAGTAFSSLRAPTPPSKNFDARGLESLPHDLHKYFERLGPDAPITNFVDFARLAEKERLFDPEGMFGFLFNLPQFRAVFEDPSSPPDLSEFMAAKAAYLRLFTRVLAQHKLDAMVLPQMRAEVPSLYGTEMIEGTAVGEVNIAGLPAVNVPAGHYASGAPFSLIFIGDQWRETELLAYAGAYETATRHRRVPDVVTFG